ncbi:TPA: leucine-rich repeat domain-containing protein [Photobacterium damselae]
MSVFSSFLNGLKKVSKTVLRMFNPFEDDGYRSASREEQDRFQEEVEIIANDKTLDHEYRMEAQRVLANIESYRHAEEMARIEGMTTITVAQIEGTKDIVIAKLDLYKSSLIRSSKKELALIDAMSKNSELIDLFIERLDTVSVEVKELVNKVELYNNEVAHLTSLSKSSPIPIGMDFNEVIALDNKFNNNHREWADKLWAWEEALGINVLPKSFKSLIRLTTLDLSSNELIELPVEIGNLTNLTVLDLNDNELIELPVEIGNLTNLIKLNLDDNILIGLPVEISKLTNLKVLFLDNQNFMNVPLIISTLTNLNELSLNNNNLKELPVEICNLTNLTGLWLDDNNLVKLPVEISNLTNLNELSLNNNNLKELPVEIGYLTNLTDIDLDGNNLNLKELPIEIRNLI